MLLTLNGHNSVRCGAVALWPVAILNDTDNDDDDDNDDDNDDDSDDDSDNYDNDGHDHCGNCQRGCDAAVEKQCTTTTGAHNTFVATPAIFLSGSTLARHS